MAEGVLGGLLSGEEEVAEAQLKAELLAGADAFAIATVIEQTRHNPKVAEATLVFLQKQARMLEVQTAQAEAEQAVGYTTCMTRRAKAACAGPASR